MYLKKAKNFLKKHKVLLIVLSTILTFVTTITLLSINWTDLKIIYAAGSSAVAPLMEALNPSISTSKDSFGNIDLNVSSTGSGNGIEVAINGSKHLGNVSRFPKLSEAGSPSFDNNPAITGAYSKEWENRKLKTITIGWDAICIIYKPKNPSFVLDINDKNIASLYQVISGTKQLNLSSLNGDDSIVDNTTIKPYARTGGAIKSGTTEAFLTNSNLSFNNEQIKEAIHILEIGAYKSNVITTKESNIETWVQIKNADYGAMTYLSGGFVLSNIKEINNYGFKVATYNGIEIKEETITNGYNWYRPFNTITSISVDDYVKYWVQWVLDPKNTYVDNIFSKIGIVRLNEKQLSSMCINDNFDFNYSSFWVSDYQLIKETKKIHYGAITN